MPANKYALLRYRIIDRCLTNPGKPFPTKEELRQACEEALYGSDGEHISISTVEKDLWAMRNEADLGYYAPIEYHRDERGYHYTEEGYSINDVQLNDDDLDAIRFATNTLIQFRDLPIFQQFDQALGKIADRLAVSPNLDTDGMDKFIQFESTPHASGSEHLAPLLQAIRAHDTASAWATPNSSDSDDTSPITQPPLPAEGIPKPLVPLGWDDDKAHPNLWVRPNRDARGAGRRPLSSGALVQRPATTSPMPWHHRARRCRARRRPCSNATPSSPNT